MTKFSKEVTNVIVITEAAEEVYEEVVKLYESSMSIFEKQKGFLGGTVLKSADTNKLVGVLQWQSRADHEACLQSPVWQGLKDAPRWFELMESGKIKTQPEVYTVLSQSC
jgi:heme-degrading monooxygenase HmoA